MDCPFFHRPCPVTVSTTCQDFARSVKESGNQSPVPAADHVAAFVVAGAPAWYRDPEREFSRLVQQIERLQAMP
jgi:hypothetical protein